MANISSTLETQPLFIDDLIKDINKGEIKIPKFQRKFIWTTEQAINLLDSIANNYPIGSLLFWKTQDKLPNERNVGNFTLPETKSLVPTTYVLDGQQRVTVIYAALSEVASNGLSFAYDLERQKFTEYTAPVQPSLFPDYHIFPLRYISNITALLNFRTEIQNHPNSAVLGPRLDTLIKIIQSYKIPVVTLSDLAIDEVCPIFERINSSGTRLSVYDLMVAATWSPQFDLNDSYNAIIDSLGPKSFDDIEGDTVLKCLAAVQWRQVNRNDILKLREVKNQINNLVQRTQDALSRTVDILANEFKVHSLSYLPYEAILVILCAILSDHKTLDAGQVKRIRQWFWRAAFSERYRGAADNFISNDIKMVEEYVIFNRGTADTFGTALSPTLLTSVAFRVDSSRSKAFILALASRQPRNITNGAVIDTYSALSGVNKKQYHHFYPKAHLRGITYQGNIDALANICMLSASENNKISDTPPSLYVPQSTRTLGNRVSDVFKSNFLPDPDRFDYTAKPYSDFLSERALILHEALLHLCNGEHF